MNDKRSGRINLLRSILSVLVGEWGLETLHVELERLRTADRGSDLSGVRISDALGGMVRATRATEKPTAAMLADKVSLPPAQKELIRRLAIKFDNKHFLPTAGDVKYFFEVHGEAVPTVKQRSESFRRVLRVLSSLPESSLRKMIDDGAHSGPSSLAPLSDAMREVGTLRFFGESESSDDPPNQGSASSDT
jgi:hypothetical protein